MEKIFDRMFSATAVPSVPSAERIHVLLTVVVIVFGMERT
jgi:hypothetical protein